MCDDDFAVGVGGRFGPGVWVAHQSQDVQVQGNVADDALVQGPLFAAVSAQVERPPRNSDVAATAQAHPPAPLAPGGGGSGCHTDGRMLNGPLAPRTSHRSLYLLHPP